MILLRGLLVAVALAMPVNIFVSIMGGASPGSKGFFHSFGLVLGMELGCALAFLLLARIVDSLLSLAPAWTTFSYAGIVIASLLFVVLFNVFVDNLFQFKQGNYGISVYGFIGLLVFWGGVIFVGRLF
ncbi:MAG: hypothetical protein JNM27_10670 [Leptospirales bacterium]|nr:hypothetical protein [Leptospirales bacterium]